MPRWRRLNLSEGSIKVCSRRLFYAAPLRTDLRALETDFYDVAKFAHSQAATDPSVAQETALASITDCWLYFTYC